MNSMDAYSMIRLLAALAFIVALTSLKVKFKTYNRLEKLNIVNKNRMINQILAHILFVFAVFFIIIMTLLNPAPPPSLPIAKSIENNYVPFVIINELINTNSYIVMAYNIIGNIALFIPLGLSLPLKYTKMRKFTYCIFVGFSFSVGIELCQLLLPHRQTDIDDVILNTLGTIIGYYLYKVQRQPLTNIGQS